MKYREIEYTAAQVVGRNVWEWSTTDVAGVTATESAIDQSFMKKLRMQSGLK